MGDIVYDTRIWLDAHRPRQRTHWQDCHIAKGHTECLVRKLLDEIERLQGYRDEAESEASIARLLVDGSRLTGAERLAIEYYIGTGGPDAVDATLRGLLDRLKPIGSVDCDRPKPIESTPETQATPCKCRVRTKGTCE